MRTVIINIILTFGFTLCFITAVSQNDTTQVKKSRNKIILEGEVYYIHVVKEKETLYAISRTYNVTEKLIALENPDVFAGLRVGMVLKIPAVPYEAEETEIKSTEDYIYHVIRQDETLYSLSRKYDITIEEIEKHNPEVQYSNLQINQVIKIPKKRLQVTLQEFPDEEYIFHYVKQGETLYSISRMYQVSIDNLRQINPELQDGELKYGGYLKIPRSTYRSELVDTAGIQDLVIFDTVSTMADSMYIITKQDWECDSIYRYERKEKITVGLFLPFLLHWEEIMDSIAMERHMDSLEYKARDESYKINPRMIGFLEFYEGALLAIDSLKKTGISIDLRVYDTERDPAVVENLISRIEMQDLDLIIGPVTQKNLFIMSEFSQRNSIPLVSPFADCYPLLRYNPFLFQLAPSFDIEIRRFSEFISCFYDKTIIMIHEGDPIHTERMYRIKNELFRQLSEKTRIENVLFKEVIYNDTLQSDLSHVLTRDPDNVVLLPSTNEPFVSNVITTLNFLLKDYHIIVLGMPNWQRFRSIDLQYFHSLQMHYYTSFFIDYKKEGVRNFIDLFNRYYHTEPYRVTSKGYNLSMYGYDIMFYFVNAIADYGSGFSHCLENNSFQPLLGDYEFKRVGYFGGYMNSYISIIRYDTDLNIEKLDLDHLPEFYRSANDRKTGEIW